MLYGRAFQTTKKQYDLYSVFIELALGLSKKDGVHSFIVPDSLIGRSNFEGTRRLIFTNATVVNWLHINNVFETANVASLIYVCKKRQDNGSLFVYQKATDVSSWKNGIVCNITIDPNNVLKSEYSKVIFAEPDKLQFLDYLRSFPTFEANAIIWRGEELGKGADVIIHSKTNGATPILSGEDVHRYEEPQPSKWIRHKDIAKDAPYSKSKVLIRQLGDRINATIDEKGLVTTQSVYSVLPLDKTKDNVYFYLGLLDSSLFDFIYRMISGDKQTFQRIILENIKALPLPQKVSPLLYQQTISLVKRRLMSSPSESVAIEKAIDDVVFQLYNLSLDMIRIVQSR